MPPFAVEVGCLALGRRQIKPLAHECDIGMVITNLQHRTIGNLCRQLTGLGRKLASSDEISLAQRLEGRMRWMQLAQFRAGISRCRDACQQVGRRRHLWFVVEPERNAVGLEAKTECLSGIGYDGKRHIEFAASEC